MQFQNYVFSTIESPSHAMMQMIKSVWQRTRRAEEEAGAEWPKCYGVT